MLLTDLAVDLRNDQRLNTQRVKSLIDEAVMNLSPQVTSPNYHAYKQLRKRLKEENLALVKADKGNSLVLMERAAYTQRVYEFLKSSNTIEIPFSIKSINNKIRAAISSSAHAIPWKEEQKENKLYVKCYSTPCLYGQIKTHKSAYP